MHPITILSFGYLHGPEPEADIVEDLREKLRDPAHVLPEEKRDMTGLDVEIEKFVFSTRGVEVVFGSILDRTLEKAAEAPATVAIGCAGGRHRSVAVANVMTAYLQSLSYEVSVKHLHVHLPRVIREGHA